ncbi:hypothetical protein [Pontibacter pamirensis]|uniref:hypothetical protein n=1 Tax=Pontibacter pamirensis TaxID=2562824 RepID=UPI00138A3D5B|nr:hypothetical protein [Pontibacter pamirensis]
MKYAVFFKKRPSQTPGVPEGVEEVFDFEVVCYTSLSELKQKGSREPDEMGFETEAHAHAFATEIIGQGR